MRIFYLLSLALVASIILSSCGSEKAEEKETVETTEEVLLFEGVGKYEGTTPCADCAGIFTTLRLNKDMSYKLHSVYLGKSEDTFQVEGTYVWEPESKKIRLLEVPKGPDQYLFSEGKLIQLNAEGQIIEGDMASKYVFRKAN